MFFQGALPMRFGALESYVRPTETKAAVIDALIGAGPDGRTLRELADALDMPAETVRSAIETLSGFPCLHQDDGSGSGTRYTIERTWLAAWIVENAPPYQGPGR